MSRTPLALALMLAFGSAHAEAPKPADPNQRIAALEARIQALEANAEAMRRQAEAATAALEATRAEMEQLKQSPATPTPPSDSAVAVEAPATEAQPDTAPAGADASGGNGNAFNPAITLILNGSMSSHSLAPGEYLRGGFPLVGEGGPSERGLSLGESEISLASTIDDKFYGQLTLALGSEGGETDVGIEEAYVETTGLSGGFTARAGRFFSGIGYLNGHHAHTDKFFDRPLPYQAFLGNQYGDDGVQLRWVAPTDTFIEVGAEVFRGEAFPAARGQNGGYGTRTLFAHVGGDVGVESSWLFGLSALDARAAFAEDGFFGTTRLYVADATWKWAPEGNFKDGGLTLRGELFSERRDGGWSDPEFPSGVELWHGVRRGGYAEGTWRINRRWEAGYRYDWLRGLDDLYFLFDSFDPELESPQARARRHTLAFTWLNSEFSLFRLQLSNDRPNPEDTDNTVTLQYQTTLGAHGAHKF